MVFNIKSSIVAILFMAGATLARGKNVGISVKEIKEGNAKRYEVTANIQAMTGETCRVTCLHSAAAACKVAPVQSAWGNYSCRISSFSPQLVGIEIIDRPGKYTFNGVHYYDARNLVKRPSDPSNVCYFEKKDYWPSA